MGQGNSIDDFLSYSGRSSGRGSYLKDKEWKDRGYLDWWTHTLQPPRIRWAHRFPALTTYLNKDTNTQIKAYWGRDHVCWEDAGYLENQYFRDRESNEVTDRDGNPLKPTTCSLCRLIDAVSMAVFRGEIEWTAPIFRFVGSTNPKHDQVLHAGGLTGQFNSRKLSEKQLKELHERGIRQDEAWREAGHAKVGCVLTGVDNDNVRAGCVVAPEPGSIADAYRTAVKQAKMSLGDEAGDPIRNPYAIRFTYDKKLPMNARYAGVRMERIKITDEVHRLITDKPPSVARVMRKFNQKLFRDFLEAHAGVNLPWDAIFDVPQKVDGDDDDDFPPQEARAAVAPSVAAPATAVSTATIPCDKCQAPMLETATRCGQCGTTYEIVPDDPPGPGKVTGNVPPFGR